MHVNVVWLPDIPSPFGRCIMPIAAITHWKAELSAAGYGLSLAQNLSGAYPPHYTISKHEMVSQELRTPDADGDVSLDRAKVSEDGEVTCTPLGSQTMVRQHCMEPICRLTRAPRSLRSEAEPAVAA